MLLRINLLYTHKLAGNLYRAHKNEVNDAFSFSSRFNCQVAGTHRPSCFIARKCFKWFYEMKHFAFLGTSITNVRRICYCYPKIPRAAVCGSTVSPRFPVMADHVFLATTLPRYSARLLRHSVKMAELLHCAIGWCWVWKHCSTNIIHSRRKNFSENTENPLFAGKLWSMVDISIYYRDEKKAKLTYNVPGWEFLRFLTWKVLQFYSL